MSFDLEALKQHAAHGKHEEVFDLVIAHYRSSFSSQEPQAAHSELFEALVIKNRYQNNLKLFGKIDYDSISPDQADSVKAGYKSACQELGAELSNIGCYPQAWAYLQIVNDVEGMREHLKNFNPEEKPEHFEQFFEVAYNQGLAPLLAFGHFLNQKGICDSISLLEGQFPFAVDIRNKFTRLLTQHFYKDLCYNLQIQVQKEAPSTTLDEFIKDLAIPKEYASNSLGKLMKLGGQKISHCVVDDSHLQSIIRFGLASEITASTLEVLIELCEYGAGLPPHFQLNEMSPFLDFYSDYRLLYLALLSNYDQSIQAEVKTEAIDHFQLRLQESENRKFPAEVLAFLLIELKEYDQALQLLIQEFPNSMHFGANLPPLFDLIQMAGQHDLLKEQAEQHHKWLYYAISLIKEDSQESPSKQDA